MLQNRPAAPIRVTDFLEKAEKRCPEKPAVSFQGETLNWQETARRCRGLAQLLMQAGVKKGDRVAYLGFNSRCCFESYYAPALIGAMLVPVNYRLSLGEMIECIDDSAPRVIIVDASHVEQAIAIKKECVCVERLLFAGKGTAPSGMLSCEQAVAELDCDNVANLTPSENDDTVMFFYTGGTTGRSKGVMLTNRNLAANTTGTVPLYKLKEGETFLIAGPMFHLAAGARVFTVAEMGGHCVILPKFDALEVLQAIEKYNINSITMVPTMFQLLLGHPKFNSFDLSSLRMITYGAAPMPMALMSRIIRAFPGADIYQSFGMTEASPVVTVLDCSYHNLDAGNQELLSSVGKPVPYVELKIFDEDNRELACGEIGEIVVRGPNIMKGYWQLPELSRQSLEGGWYHTGDAGYVNQQGFLYLEGRVKDMIVSGGENVYPIEVENVLSDHPAVHQCAVIGIPHATWGEAVHGVISLKKGESTSEGELIEFCRERLAHYKCPVSVSIWQESLPLSAVNKILKSELRKPFWEGRKSQLI